MTKEEQASAKDLKTVKTVCMAQICVSLERLENFTRIFQEQLKRYASSLEEKRPEVTKRSKSLSIKDQPLDRTKNK